MTGMIWDETTRAAQILAAAKAERDPRTQAELRRSAFALLRSQAIIPPERGPAWPEVLISHSK